MNHLIIIGNLTKDPELSTTTTGKSRCVFSVAVNKAMASKDGKREADFISVQFFGREAENCAKYLRKGRRVGIEGCMTSYAIYDDQSGQKRYIWYCLGQRIEFLDAADERIKRDASQDTKGAKKEAERIASDPDFTFEMTETDEELPF